MKTWNTPELQELDVRLTATGEEGSLYEEEATIMPFCDNDEKPGESGSDDKHKPGKPGGSTPEFS